MVKDEMISMIKGLIEEHEVNHIISDEEKVKAAYALNLCMVSVSQIIDYDDINILEQEYENILNNLNLEMMPKDEALLSVIKQLLDTTTFFRIQEGDKEILDQEYQQRMKNAIWNAIPNFGVILTGESPVSIAVSLASQVGIGYMNYRRSKVENALVHKKEKWHLQRSAMEQFNCLRRELFDTAWRLAEVYRFPDTYRLTERQIKQYNNILMDPDEIRKYERLTTIKDNFMAYPPFWYHYGSTANHIARNERLALAEESRRYYKKEAIRHFDLYWRMNKYALLREDILASSCALEYIDLLDANRDKDKILHLLELAVRYSGYKSDVLQLCAISYMKLNEREKASEILRALVNEEYNITINAQILSAIYVHDALEYHRSEARAKYETLSSRVNKEYLLRMPEEWERISEQELKDEFEEHQEELLFSKFDAVIRYYCNDFSIRLGKLIPGTDMKRMYPDFYYSEEGMEQRYRDIEELFSSSYKQKRRAEYLSVLSQRGFVNMYFEELNKFFGEVSGLNCIRDRQRLQEIISKEIIEHSDEINCIEKNIENKKLTKEELFKLLEITSLDMFDEFIKELKNQIRTTIWGMNDNMARYAVADSNLRTFCLEHQMPEPDELISDGSDAESDTELITNYFGLDLLNPEKKKNHAKGSGYRRIEGVIKRHINELDAISSKSMTYFHDSAEFNTYFEKGVLKRHKDILQKTIAVYDDSSIRNVDVLFTTDGLVPVVRNIVKKPIPYMALASKGVQEQATAVFNSIKVKLPDGDNGENIKTTILRVGLQMAITGVNYSDTNVISQFVSEIQPIIDEICQEIVSDTVLLGIYGR